ncbi:MAG: YhgE/Pip domain-containing protein [Eubacterium sp.]|nr:YhgE/Pip domain-containing protein [Eubacterium sp.]
MSVKKKKSSIIMKAAIIIGVLVIPLLYSYFYLSAFWDPYAKLNDVPVAVVNLDQGAAINGKERNIGEEICEELRENNTVKFIFTDDEDARNGVLEDNYYAAIIIPENLSQSISTASADTEKIHGEITYLANQKKNYLAAQILENAMPTIKESVNGKIDQEIIQTLCDKLNSVPDEMGELQDGFNQLYDGSSQIVDATDKLNNGAGNLKNGTAALSSGSIQVNTGARDLKNGLLQLQDGVGTLSSSAPALANGVNALNSGAASLDIGLKTIAANNDKLNAGASQLSDGSTALMQGIGTYTSGVSAAENGAELLNSGINTYTAGVTTAQQGADTLYTGIVTASDGINQISQGVDHSINYLNTTASDERLDALDSGAGTVNEAVNSFSTTYTAAMNYLNAYQQTGNPDDLAYAVGYLSALQQKLPELQAGTSQLETGVNTLTNGMRSVKTSTAQLQAGLNQVKAGFGNEQNPQTLIGGAYMLKGGLGQLTDNNHVLNGGINTLRTGLNTLSANSSSLNTGAQSLVDGAAQLQNGVKDYTSGVSTASNGAVQLANGTNELSDKVPMLTSGAAALSDGTAQLVDGAGKLTDGTTALNNGAKELDNGASALREGTDTLLSGTQELKTGISTAKNGVDDSIKDTNEQLKALVDLPDYAAQPIATGTEYIQPVENYGSAFAPYFMGLSLWVGGLMIFFGIYLDYHKKIGKLTKDSTSPVIRQLCFIGISSLQGILLAVVIKDILGITVNNAALLFASCWLVSLAFMAIIQFCIMHLGDAGKFVALLLLILQLTSCAGTFPIETQSGFFQVINRFLPMTYSTLLFKEAISGEAGSQAFKYIMIILAYLVVSLIISVICLSVSKAKKSKEIDLINA